MAYSLPLLLLSCQRTAQFADRTLQAVNCSDTIGPGRAQGPGLQDEEPADSSCRRYERSCHFYHALRQCGHGSTAGTQDAGSRATGHSPLTYD
eukprot:810380-Pleurochrysis_carterae.AAC.1